MWGRGRFHNAAVSQRAVATPTVLTPSRPDPGPSGGTRKTTMLDLGKSVTQTFGRAALVQRCQVHKGRNILEHLPEAQRPWVKVVLTRAYTNSHVKTAKRLLQDLARRLDTDYPSAATSVREGLDETLTVLGLGLSERLQRSLNVVKGDLSASEDLTIEGRVEGTITVGAHTLTVGHHGQIEAQIVARVATIRGTVHGDVTATEKVEILATGSLDGDVMAPRIAIAEGACFRGKMDIQPGNAE